MRKQSVDFPGIMIGIVIGLIFGFLINSRLRDPIMAPTMSEITTNEVVLLQVYRTENPESITSFCEGLEAIGLKTVWVRDGSTYFVYHAIGKTEEDLAVFKANLDQKAVSYVVKHQSMANYPNNVLGEESYEFWNQGVYDFLLALENKSFTIDEDYLSHPYSSEFHKNLVYLNALKNTQSIEEKNDLLLETYKLIVENLS